MRYVPPVPTRQAAYLTGRDRVCVVVCLSVRGDQSVQVSSARKSVVSSFSHQVKSIYLSLQLRPRL